jgi:hypothetical protein
VERLVRRKESKRRRKDNGDKVRRQDQAEGEKRKEKLELAAQDPSLKVKKVAHNMRAKASKAEEGQLTYLVTVTGEFAGKWAPPSTPSSRGAAIARARSLGQRSGWLLKLSLRWKSASMPREPFDKKKTEL